MQKDLRKFGPESYIFLKRIKMVLKKNMKDVVKLGIPSLWVSAAHSCNMLLYIIMEQNWARLIHQCISHILQMSMHFSELTVGNLSYNALIGFQKAIIFC